MKIQEVGMREELPSDKDAAGSPVFPGGAAVW